MTVRSILMPHDDRAMFISAFHECRQGRFTGMALIMARTFRFWFPFLVAAVLLYGIAFEAHGQPASNFENSIDIATLKREFSDLQDLPAQTAAIRERMIALETTIHEHSTKLDDIAANEKWVVLGIIGLLATKIMDRLSSLNKGGQSRNDHDSGTLHTLGE